jgi:hypothetical protein
MWQWSMYFPVKSRKRDRKVMLPLRGTIAVSHQIGSDSGTKFSRRGDKGEESAAERAA